MGTLWTSLQVPWFTGIKSLVADSARLQTRMPAGPSSVWTKVEARSGFLMKWRSRVFLMPLSSASGRKQLGHKEGCIEAAPGVHLKASWTSPQQWAWCRGWELTSELVRVHAMPKAHVDLPFTLFNPPPQQIPSLTWVTSFPECDSPCKPGFSSPPYHPAPIHIPAEFVFRRWSWKRSGCLNIEQGEWLSGLMYSFPRGFCTS